MPGVEGELIDRLEVGSETIAGGALLVSVGVDVGLSLGAEPAAVGVAAVAPAEGVP
jgi:hypothetical protein